MSHDDVSTFTLFRRSLWVVAVVVCVLAFVAALLVQRWVVSYFYSNRYGTAISHCEFDYFRYADAVPNACGWFTGKDHMCVRDAANPLHMIHFRDVTIISSIDPVWTIEHMPLHHPNKKLLKKRYNYLVIRYLDPAAEGGAGAHVSAKVLRGADALCVQSLLDIQHNQWFNETDMWTDPSQGG